MENHFKKFDQLPLKLGLYNRKKNKSDKKIHFRDGIRWIRVEKFGEYSYKECLDENTEFEIVNCLKNKKTTEICVYPDRVSEKYGNISKEKLLNLKQQLQFVHEEYKYYYENILRDNKIL